ncbi:G/U mismatch-specific DNA glycosylase [Actinacidiphila glaucinigra]|uniref:G/U mismatch-specific DNA glycosylase n=1 Tax=Actinacidiphila glaucinigra TaxID=235986 RepID=UPI00324EF7FF
MIADGLRVLFCGINPGLMSAATGHHFARPGNRFWPVLHASGFTPRRLDPAEQDELLASGLGITNVVARASARADELTRDELLEGGRLLTERVLRYEPRWLAVVGVTAYRVAFAEPRARIGPQERTIGGTRIWALPNPSGLNAGWSTQAMTEEFGRLRDASQG